MKQTLKSMIAGFFAVLVLPCVLAYRLQATFCGATRAFPGWSHLMSLFPGITGVYLRQAFFRQTTAGCEADACISFGTLFSDPGVRIGRSAYLGNYCSIGNVAIGDDVLIASHVSVMNGVRQHGTERLDIPMREQPGMFEPISIGCDTWIGERATVAASVGRHCIIGAGALVLSPIPDYAIAVGVPARVIRDRRDSTADAKPGRRDAESLPELASV